MRTKIVYVTVSNGKDNYLEQLYMSLVSLKMHNPNSHSSVVVDRITEKVISKVNYDLKSYIDDLIIIDVPTKYQGAVCSRYLKTSLRSYVTGPYLFIDTDTIVSENLEDIDELIDREIDVAAVVDGHCPFKEMPNYSEIVERYNKIGWLDLLSDEYHFNSGVMFVADTKAVHDFYEQWHQNWLYEYSKHYYFDQIALARTDHDMGGLLVEIDGIWNFQLYWGALRYLCKAKIVHYGGYSRRLETYYFRTIGVPERIRATGKIDSETFEHLQNPKEAYVGNSLVLGNEYQKLLRSKMNIEFMYHPHRFQIFDSVASFLQHTGEFVRNMLTCQHN